MSTEEEGICLSIRLSTLAKDEKIPPSNYFQFGCDCQLSVRSVRDLIVSLTRPWHIGKMQWNAKGNFATPILCEPRQLYILDSCRIARMYCIIRNIIAKSHGVSIAKSRGRRIAASSTAPKIVESPFYKMSWSLFKLYADSDVRTFSFKKDWKYEE